MENGTYTKQYPKEFQQKTIQTHDGYLEYERSDDGVTIKNKQCKIRQQMGRTI